MIDEEDADFVLLMWPSGGIILTLLGLMLAAIFYWVAASNAEDCAKKACSSANEHAELLDHACVCVSSPRESP